MTPRSHRLLDWLAVALFAAAPFALGLAGAAAVVSYALAVTHLVLTVLTRFPVPSADSRPVPLTAHGAIEILIGIALLVMPWIVPAFSMSARAFLAVMGGVLVVVWKLTPYELGDEAAAADPGPEEPRGPQRPPRP